MTVFLGLSPEPPCLEVVHSFFYEFEMETYTASTGLNSLKISVQSSYYVVTNEEAD